MWIKIQQMQQYADIYLFIGKLLYMFRVSQHPSSGLLKSVPAASGTVFNTPDDGCCDTRNM